MFDGLKMGRRIDIYIHKIVKIFFENEGKKNIKRANECKMISIWFSVILAFIKPIGIFITINIHGLI